MATMCVDLRMTPQEYWKLKADEYAALVDELNRRAKAMKAAQRG
jgi:hypothetical protein